jgi:hypothetical protein
MGRFITGRGRSTGLVKACIGVIAERTSLLANQLWAARVLAGLTPRGLAADLGVNSPCRRSARLAT